MRLKEADLLRSSRNVSAVYEYRSVPARNCRGYPRALPTLKPFQVIEFYETTAIVPGPP